jgi:hypothetical protein
MKVRVSRSSAQTSRRRRSKRPTPPRQRVLSASSRSAATGDSFERQPEKAEGAAHCGDRYPHPVRLLEELAVLGQGEVSGLARAWSGRAARSAAPFRAVPPRAWARRRRPGRAASGSALWSAPTRRTGARSPRGASRGRRRQGSPASDPSSTVPCRESPTRSTLAQAGVSWHVCFFTVSRHLPEPC